jgi:ABC-type amino acid transport substrate-binding protein
MMVNGPASIGGGSGLIGFVDLMTPMKRRREDRMRMLTAAAATLVAALAAPASALDICFEGTYPPFSEIQSDGTPTGFDIDIARALFEEIGESFAFIETRWTDMIPSLTGKRCDAIVASMSDTPARRQDIDFTVPYYRSPLRFVARAGAAAESKGWPEDRVIGVQLDTVGQNYMDAHYPATELRLYGNQEHLLLDLYAGRLDAALGESAQLDAGFLQTPAGEGFAFVGPPMFDPAIQGTGAAIGVRKEDAALRDKLSAAIEVIRANGVYQHIQSQYFKTDIYGS